MPLIYSTENQTVLHQLINRCSSIEFGRALINFCFILLISFFSSIIFQYFIRSPTSSFLPSSSLTFYSSSHIFFPADSTSLQCIPEDQQQLKNTVHEPSAISKKRIFIRDRVQTVNISSALEKEAEVALHLALQLVREKKFKKARRIFEHALLLNPYDAELMLEYGQFLANHHQDFIRAENLFTRVLVKQPEDNRALELKRRTLPLVEEIDQKAFSRIDNLLKEFYRIPDSNPHFRKAKRDAYYLNIYHSNAIEGNTLSLSETKLIIDTRMAIGGKSLIEQQEVLGLDAALHYVNCTLVNRLNSITRQDIMDIHRRVLGFVNPIEAGQIRREQVYVGSFIPPAPQEVSSYMDDFIQWLNSLDEIRDLHAIELAALAHYKFVYIHPFIDGNGRTGRLLMNWILMRSAFPPVIIKFSDRLVYYAHLDQANDGDVRPFIRFIANCTERTLTEFLEKSQPIQNREEFRLADYENDHVARMI